MACFSWLLRVVNVARLRARLHLSACIHVIVYVFACPPYKWLHVQCSWLQCDGHVAAVHLLLLVGGPPSRRLHIHSH